MYKKGEGTQKNEEKALQYYKESANQGYAKAENELGSYYYDRENYKAALKWYDEAANQGNADAEYALGLIYYKGESGKIDLVASTPTLVVVPSISEAFGSKEEPLALGTIIISSSPFTRVAIAYSMS